eukprot:3558024-Heterocapsa_arctica.AAC.1
MQRARGLEMLGGEQQHLDFCLDAAFFVDFHRRCHAENIDDISVSELSRPRSAAACLMSWPGSTLMMPRTSTWLT